MLVYTIWFAGAGESRECVGVGFLPLEIRDLILGRLSKSGLFPVCRARCFAPAITSNSIHYEFKQFDVNEPY